MRKSYWKRFLGHIFVWLYKIAQMYRLIPVALCQLWFYKNERTSKTVRRVSAPLSPRHTQKTHSSKVSFPTRFLDGTRLSSSACARVTLMGATARPLMRQLSGPTGFGQQEQWQSRTIRGKMSTDCVMALTAFHTYIGKNRSTVFLKQSICLSSLCTQQVSFQPYPMV